MQVQIQIPKFWSEVATYLTESSDQSLCQLLCVETAHLDIRADKAICALALALPGNYAILVPDISAARWAIESWDIRTLKHRSLGEVHQYRDTQSGDNLWLVTDVEKLKSQDYKALIIIDAHLIVEPPLPGNKIVVIGRFSERGHWFYKLARRAATKRTTIDLPRILESQPLLINEALVENDARYERDMLVRDVVPNPLPFLVVAKRYYKIRTDKTKEFLSPLQQKEADQYRTSNKQAAAIVSFEPSRVQRRYLALKRIAHRQGKTRIILLKYRRGGFTTLEQAESYNLVATTPNSFVATLADVKEKTQRIFRIAKLLHEQDEKAQPEIGNSKTTLELANGSFFFIGTAGSRAFGRGDTLQRAHCSEVAYWGKAREQNVEEIGLFMSGITEAASNGIVIAESTPNGREWFCQTYEAAKRNENDWFPIFLPWFIDTANRLQKGTFNEEEVSDTLTEEETEVIRSAIMNYKTTVDLAMIAFRRKKKKDLKHLFAQEYPENDVECFLTSGLCFFDTDQMIRLLDTVKEGKRKHLPGGYEVRWKEPEKGREYVAGCDTSEGIIGGDPSGIGILDSITGEQVAAIHGLFKPDILAHHAARICRDYNKALLGVERNNHGHAVLQKLKEIKYGEPHYRGGPLYFFEVEEALSSHAHGKVRQKGRAGWDTNSRTRPIMLSGLEEATREKAIGINHKEFVSECLSFKLQSDGKFQADIGANDDTVMFWAIAWQMRKMPRRSSGVMSADARF